MRWLDRLDAWGHRLDARWARWLDHRVAGPVQATVVFVIEVGFPILSILAALYLLSSLIA